MTDQFTVGGGMEVDRGALLGFLVTLREDLDKLVGLEAEDSQAVFDLFGGDDGLFQLASEAYQDRVGERIDELVRRFDLFWPAYYPSLDAHGLAGANLAFKLTLAARFREEPMAAIDQSRGTRRLFEKLARYFSVSSSIVGSIKEAMNNLPPELKLLVELIKEMLDMLTAQSADRAESRQETRDGRVF